MKVKNLVYILLILGIGAFVTYRITQNNKEEAPATTGQKAQPKVYGMVLEPQEFKNNLSLSGSIEANEQIDLRSEVSGIVESINFIEGSMVQQGQVLFKVNDIELRAQLAQVKTAQNLASENERRAKLLLQKEAISQEEYDIASADFKSSKAQSQLIQAQLSKATVRAPFSGKIGLRYISKGTYVTPATPIAKLINTSKLKITFSIPEKYASQIKMNTVFSFTTSGATDRYDAKVYAIEPEIDVMTRTLKVRAIAENKEGKLFPGTFANVMLPLETLKDALLVPTESLIPIQNGKKIFVVRDGKAKEVVVETGTRTNDDILITSGLKAGDTVLVSGVMTLKDDSPVNVVLKK